MSARARCPRITAASAVAGQKKKTNPQSRLAVAFPLFSCGPLYVGCVEPIGATATLTPQYGHTGTQSARLPLQLGHWFTGIPPIARLCVFLLGFLPSRWDRFSARLFETPL